MLDELRQDLMSGVSPGRDCLLDGPTLAAWLDEIDDVQLLALVMELCAQVIETNSELPALLFVELSGGHNAYKKA